MAEWVRTGDLARPFDLVIANAGVSGESGDPGERAGQSEWIYRVNVLGVLNTVEPLLPAMRERGRGQIGLVASLAGFRGSLRGSAYAGSKAAIVAQGQGWRERLAADGVGVTVICPGYINTPMTERHRFRMPFVLEPDIAAHRIVAALTANKGLFIFPWPLPIAAWLFRLLPASATTSLIPRAED
jgi:short-subunit dehydrogenase